MPSHEKTNKSTSRAELAFREAFKRLQNGCPNILPKGSKVTQNNVAREAGLDPSALKKARFPDLVEEIQTWIDQFLDGAPPSKNQVLGAQRQKNKSLQEQIKSLKEQRDIALSLLVEADSKIFELTLDNRRLLALSSRSNVISMQTRGKD